MLENNSTDLLSEFWAIIPGYPGYQISNLGRVYSHAVNRLLTGSVTDQGYRKYKLKREDGRKKDEYGHRLVLLAWVGEPPDEDAQCCHRDGDKLNNVLTNLRWDTAAGNSQDSMRLGSHVFGMRHPQSILSDREVIRCRAYAALGYPLRDLAALYGVKTRTVYNLVYGNTWGHIRWGIAPKVGFAK